MEVKKIVEGMTAPQVAQVIDDNFKAQNKILEEDIVKQNNVIGVSEYKDFSEAETVNVGDVRKYNGLLYECVEATSGAWDESKWKKSSFKDETEKKLSELGSEVNGTILVAGNNEYNLVEGNEYRFANEGSGSINIGYIDNLGTYVRIASLNVGQSVNFIATINSATIKISDVGGVKCVAYDLSTSVTGRFETYKEQTNNSIKDIHNELNGIVLKGGSNNYPMAAGKTYAFVNDGNSTVNVGYKVDSYQSSSTAIFTNFKPKATEVFVAAENSSIITISSIEGASIRVYDSVVVNMFNNEKTLEDYNEAISGNEIIAGKETPFAIIQKETYYFENTGDVGFDLYYRDEEGNSNLITSLGVGKIYKYTPTKNGTSVYVSNIVGARGAVYDVDSIGYDVAKMKYESLENKELVDLQLVGRVLSSGNNSLKMAKGKTYVFVNEGVGVNIGYRVSSDSENISMGTIGKDGIFTYMATEDSSIIYLSNISGVSVRVYVKSNFGGASEYKPFIVKACSFNFGDFTGEGFDTPSEEGKLVYKRLIGKIGANLMGTQEDVEFYGQTTSGQQGSESVRNCIFPMYLNYYRQGTSMYNFKAFASDYNIINVERVNYTGDYYFTHPWFLKGNLNINGKNILILSFHWDWRDTEIRNIQIDQMLAYAQNYDYVIALGDTNSLNAKDGEYIQDDLYKYDIEWQKFKDAGYDMANNGNFGLFVTTHGESPIDNIFVKGGKIKNAYTIKEDWMRDHYPIVADIVI